ncbi:NAD-dependent epimerase/dehydratase family protein [Sphingomonas jatrophae]|uniref:Nucleoside-diphosphate-sugar epimerase n=1 Tax=Sphingomonas jatrophae TaxID=1166337 RepID=A0A1I6KFC3_9SPHN|nr:NAD(P)-dependent oxidoreductase [Sphingomonas jatrophae]SFR89929.1 Nucleoside-diphosphate-sugar epimerase [Sphingomonas jatrophae]
MKILIVGGTGMIGGHAALHLAGRGHAVTLAARRKPAPGTAIDGLPVLIGDYAAGDFATADLSGFDALIFAAGNDIRHLPEGTPAEDHYHEANTVQIPRFFERARDGGIETAIYIGSFYPQAAPHVVDGDPYLMSRKAADERVRALDAPGFRVCSLNAPVMVGAYPGLAVPFFDAYFAYALGLLDPMPVFCPPGASNFMSVRSLAEAMEGAIARGAGGTAYLVGDDDMTYQDYFHLFFETVGSPLRPKVRDEEHPLLPDAAQPAGRGGVIRYEPTPAETALLGYRCGDVRSAVEALYDDYKRRHRMA